MISATNGAATRMVRTIERDTLAAAIRQCESIVATIATEIQPGAHHRLAGARAVLAELYGLAARHEYDMGGGR